MYPRNLVMACLHLFLGLTFGWFGWTHALHAQLLEGDRIVFCGDSITDQKTYTRLVMDYFALRHPGTKLVFFNVGITGSTAGGWKKDGIQKHVLPLKPTLVTLCLGMNDGGYRAYEPKTGDTYEANLMALITDIKAGGARVALLTPGAIDDDTIPPRFAKGVYNDTLARLAKRVETIGARENIPVFNIHNLMLEIQTRAKTQTPAFTMIPDGVHPGEVGATAMAYGLLKVLGPIRPAASLRLDASAKTTETSLCTVQNLNVTDDHLTFTRTDHALPTFLPKDAIVALQPHTAILEELNEYRLAVTNLKQDTWKLQVEDALAGVFTSEDLARGVNLGNMPGPWQLLGGKVDRLAAEASHVYDVVFHGLSQRHFPQAADSASPQLRELAAEIETARVAYIQKVIALYEADEWKRGMVPASERTWRWTFTRMP